MHAEPTSGGVAIRDAQPTIVAEVQRKRSRVLDGQITS